MTKQEILDKFNDINFVYNDSSKHETLYRMLDELLKEQEIVRCKDCQKRCFDDCPVNGWMPDKADGNWFCADGERRTE